MYRVLKPGAKLSFLDYVQLPAYNSSDPTHLDFLHKVKPVLGAVWTPKPSDFTDALEQVLRALEANFVAVRLASRSFRVKKPAKEDISIHSLRRLRHSSWLQGGCYLCSPGPSHVEVEHLLNLCP